MLSFFPFPVGHPPHPPCTDFTDQGRIWSVWTKTAPRFEYLVDHETSLIFVNEIHYGTSTLTNVLYLYCVVVLCEMNSVRISNLGWHFFPSKIDPADPITAVCLWTDLAYILVDF